nr:MAG TPA: hypothetical protein [Caudoviricetes sp.]
MECIFTRVQRSLFSSSNTSMSSVYPSIKFSRCKKRDHRWTCDKYKILY